MKIIAEDTAADIAAITTVTEITTTIIAATAEDAAAINLFFTLN